MPIFWGKIASDKILVLSYRQMLEEAHLSQAEDELKSRRDMLFYTAGAGAAVSVGVLGVWPAINQMNETADIKALSKIQVDISGVPEGGQLVVEWQLKPVFIRHRTAAEIEEARNVDISDFRDQNSENALKPDADAADENRAIDEAGKWLVAVGLCTHLGCVPTVNAGDFGGWFCPCHASHYDTSGRVRKGPAPRNLEVPPVAFVSDTVIEIGV